MGKALEPIKTGEIIQGEPISLDPSYLAKAKGWEDFVSLWMTSKEIDIRNQWFKGDIANRITTVYGEGSIKKFAEEVHESKAMIGHYRRVSKAFSQIYREMNLTWNHYLVASFTDSFDRKAKDFKGNLRFKWVEKANDEGWSSLRLAEEIKSRKAQVGVDEIFLERYMEYLEKVKNIFTHLDKKKVKKEDAQKIIEKMTYVQNEVAEYFSDII